MRMITAANIRGSSLWRSVSSSSAGIRARIRDKEWLLRDSKAMIIASPKDKNEPSERIKNRMSRLETAFQDLMSVIEHPKRITLAALAEHANLTRNQAKMAIHYHADLRAKLNQYNLPEDRINWAIDTLRHERKKVTPRSILKKANLWHTTSRHALAASLMTEVQSNHKTCSPRKRTRPTTSKAK